MGAKTWMLVYSEGDPREALRRRPTLDRARAADLARKLFPHERLIELDDGDLSYTCPAAEELHIGCFDGVSVVAAAEFGIDSPSQLPLHFIRAGGTENVTLHAMHSVVDWFAYARWIDGKLVRSLSVSPDDGMIEDIGERLPFEEPYWAGQHPPIDPDDDDADEYPLPFHPLELGEAALNALFGYMLEGELTSTLLQPETVPLACYRRKRAWWRLWS